MKDYYLVIDTETGGLDPQIHPLLQIYAAVFDKNGKCIKEYEHWIEAEDQPLSIGALKINNYFSRKDQCVSSKYAAKSFLEWCIEIQKDYDPILVGQNLKFDLAFIKKLMDDYKYFDWNEMFRRHVLDTGVIAQAMIDAGLIKGLRKTSLNALAYAFKVPADKDKLHNAKYDAKITFEVYMEMIKCLKTAKGVSVNE